MKRNNLCLILVLTSLFATSCQKDSLTDPQSERTENMRTINSYHISYWVDGIRYSVTLQDEAQITLLIQKLTKLALLGHHIHTSNDDFVPSGNPTKDVIKFSTTDENEIIEWAKKMYQKGYDVEFYYDEATGTFSGIAIKK